MLSWEKHDDAWLARWDSDSHNSPPCLTLECRSTNNMTNKKGASTSKAHETGLRLFWMAVFLLYNKNCRQQT